MGRTWRFHCFWVGLLTLLSPVRLAAEGRVALVIGNSSYKNIQALKNPVGDARLVSEQLGKLGFEVLYYPDLDGTTMRRAIRTYSERLVALGRDTIGFVFFAGHGIQVRENNYLIPIDADIRKESDAGLEAVHLADVLNTLFEASNKLNSVILDACRDNPYRSTMRTAGMGLAGFDAPVGTLVAFSTAPGKTAFDGQGPHSPFASALAAALADPNLRVEDVFKRVSERVYASTARKQLPWFTSSVHGEFFLATGRSIAVADSRHAAAPTKPGVRDAPRAVEPWPAANITVAQQPTVREPSVPVASSPSVDLEGRIAFFIEWKFFGSDNGARRLGPESYSATLEYYYGKPAVSRSQVLNDKERYYNRWPNRRFALDRKSLKISEDSPDVYVTQFGFRFDVENDTKHSTGESMMSLKLKRIGDDFIILAQDEVIRDRNLTQKDNAPTRPPLAGAQTGTKAKP